MRSLIVILTLTGLLIWSFISGMLDIGELFKEGTEISALTFLWLLIRIFAIPAFIVGFLEIYNNFDRKQI